MEIDKDVYVPMRDGVSLAVDVYRPDTLSNHAAILLVTPYQKDGTFDFSVGFDGRPMAGATALPPMPAGMNPMLLSVGGLVKAGFVVAVADARGTGFSEGTYDYYNFEGGPFDGYDLVEWLAAQGWCTGKVGMMGASAAAISCYTTALTNPPHLEAMSANMHPGDFYFDQWRVGGVFRWENRISWSMGMHPRTGPVNPGDLDAPSYERKRAVYEARNNHYGDRAVAGKNPANLDWFTDMYNRADYDDFWKARSFTRRAAEISIPVLHGGVWFDHFGRGTLTTHEVIDVPKRLFMAPGSLMTRTDLGDGGFGELQIRWFDHFLRGAQNGVLDDEPVRLYLTGAEDYIDEPAWPVPSIETDLFLRVGPSGSVASLNDGILAVEPPATAEPADPIGHDPAAPVRSPRDIRDLRPFESTCLTFTSAPLDTALEVIGTPRLVLFASTDATDVDWCVRICDVDTEGRSKLLNTGALKGSHTQSHEEPTPLIPGDVTRFEIEFWPIANLFKAGHRVRIDVSTADFPFFESNPLESQSQVFHDPANASRLVLPVVTRQRRAGLA